MFPPGKSNRVDNISFRSEFILFDTFNETSDNNPSLSVKSEDIRLWLLKFPLRKVFVAFFLLKLINWLCNDTFVPVFQRIDALGTRRCENIIGAVWFRVCVALVLIDCPR